MDGIFSGFNEEKRSYDKSTWKYQMGEDGFAKVDDSLQDPNCVWQLLKNHYSRYTPEMVSKICGTPKDTFLKVCEYIAETAAPDKTMTNLYALGWTAAFRRFAEHPLHGDHPAAARQYGHGRRRHQRLARSRQRPGHYRLRALRAELCRATSARRPMPTRIVADLSGQAHAESTASGPDELRRRTSRSGLPACAKSWWGDAATKENDFAYDYFPKLGGASDVLSIFNAMYEGKINGFFCQGFNPLASVANKKKVSDALAKLKYMVVMDPLATDTSEYWKPHGEFNEVDPAKIPTEVFRLPTTLFAEDRRHASPTPAAVIQWRWKAADAPGDSKDDTEIMAALFLKLKEMYAKDGGAFPDPILKLTWAYNQPLKPSPEELLREINGKALADVLDPKDPTKVLVKAGEQLPSFAMLRDDGSTTCGNWIYCGVWSQAGNLIGTARQRRSVGPRADPELGLRLAGQPPHPLQPRLGRPGRQAVGSEADGAAMDRHGLGWQRRARTCARMPRPTRTSCPSS